MSEKSRAANFAKDDTDYKARRAAGESFVLAPALNLPNRVKPTVATLRQLASSIESVNPLNPLTSLSRLRRYRSQYLRAYPTADSLLEECITLLGRPVEGVSDIDFSYLQGMHVAGGMSAITSLQSAMSAVSEALDRKIAYAVASISMYVAVISLLATLILGILSLR
jgi:hypothetical protein